MVGRFGKPDATGRSSGRRNGRSAKIHGPPRGKSWVWHLTEMLRSPAWKALSINARRFLDLLEIDHSGHAGTENGGLMATYDQCEDYGIPRQLISSVIEEAIFLGFVRVVGERRRRVPNKYRLTYYATMNDLPPTNDWRLVSEAAITRWREDRKNVSKAVRRAKQNAGAESCTYLVPDSALIAEATID